MSVPIAIEARHPHPPCVACCDRHYGEEPITVRDTQVGAGRRWMILAVLFVARTAMGFQYQTIGSAAPSLLHDLQIDFAGIGTLIGLYHFAGVFLSLPSGLIARWFNDKSLCAFGLALMAAGGFVVAESHSYGIAFAGRLGSSVGVILFNLVITKMTADWFARREIVLAMAVILSTWPFGIALGLFVQPWIAAALGWRAMMLIAAGICLLSLTLVALCYRSPAAEQAAEPPQSANAGWQVLPHWPVLAPVIVAGMMWGTFNAGLVTYFSFVPTFLVEARSMTMARSGALVSVALWVGMLSIPLGGYLAQRSGRSNAVIVLFCLLAASALALLALGAPPALACIGLGLAIGPPPGVITALPTRLLRPADRAGGFGVFYTFHYLFQSTGPAIAGWLHDTVGGNAAILFAAALFATPLPLLAFFQFLTSRLAAHAPRSA